MKMMLKRTLAALALVGLMGAAVYAGDSIDAVKRNLSRNWSGIDARHIAPSPVEGLYEIRTGDGRIIYTDGELIIAGHIFNAAGKDLTRARLDELASDKLDQLDLSLAVRVGDGAKQVIEFTDPECPFCRRAEAFFEDADVTRHVFFLPLEKHANAKPLALDVLCSDDPEAAYRRIMTGDMPPAPSGKSCAEGLKLVEEHLKYANMLGVRGTPAFWIDGQRIDGADPRIKEMIR